MMVSLLYESTNTKVQFVSSSWLLGKRATIIQWLNLVALPKLQQMGAIMGFTVSIGMTCGLECDSHALACPSGLKYCRLFGQLFPCSHWKKFWWMICRLLSDLSFVSTILRGGVGEPLIDCQQVAVVGIIGGWGFLGCYGGALCIGCGRLRWLGVPERP